MQIFNPNTTVLFSSETDGNWRQYSANTPNGWKSIFGNKRVHGDLMTFQPSEVFVNYCRQFPPVFDENRIVGLGLKIRIDWCRNCHKRIKFVWYSTLWDHCFHCVHGNPPQKISIVYSLSLDLKYLSYDTKYLWEKGTVGSCDVKVEAIHWHAFPSHPQATGELFSSCQQ